MLQGNPVARNSGTGVSVGITENIRIEANEIAHNKFDGLVVGHNNSHYDVPMLELNESSLPDREE